MTYGSTSANQNTDMTCIATLPTPLTMYGCTSANQNHQSTGMATPITSMSESSTFPRTTMPAETTPSLRQSTHEIHQNSSHSGPPTCCIHVHQPQSQACKPGELPALKKVKIPHNGKTSMNRSPLAKQERSSQFSSCFEGIGRFPGDPCKFHLQPYHQMARHVSKKQGIPEEVKEHADWIHSNIFVEKALEREPYHTHSTRETTTEFRISRESGTCQTFPNTHGNVHGRPPHSDHRGNPTTISSRHQPCRIPIRHGKHTTFPREPVPARKREKHGYRYIYNREHYSEQAPCTQHTHTSRKSSTELPATEDGKFQHGGTSMLQLQC